jgi:hypothetical protein
MPSLAEFLKENPEAAKDLEQLVSTQASAAIAKAVEPLERKKQELMDELKPLKDLQKKLGDDFSLEEYNKLRLDMQDKEKKGFVDKGQIDKLIEAHTREKAQWKEQYDKDIGERDSKLTASATEIQRLVVDGELTRELSSIAVDDSALDFLMYKAKPLLETVEADGKTVARVKNGVKGDGTYKSIKDLVADFAKDGQFARYVKGSGQSGSGASSSAGGGDGKGNEKLTSTQRIAKGLKQLG